MNRRVIFYPLSFLLLITVAWQIMAMNIHPILLPSPIRTLQALFNAAATGMLLKDAAATLWLYVRGIALAIAIGLSIGLVLGFSQRARTTLLPYIFIWNSTPRIALLPVLMVWFGISDASKIALIVLSAMIPVTVNTTNGISNVDHNLIETARAYGARTIDMILKVMIPAAVPAIAAGLTLGALRGLMVTIMAEMFLAVSGLGGRIMMFADLHQTYNVVAYAIVCMILGICIAQSAGRIRGLTEKYQV